jgi:hypothetical protein
MLGQYLITFREVFEAALITSIIFAYLIRTSRKNLTLYVRYSVEVEWARVLVHLFYLAAALPLVIWVYRRK